MGVSATAPDNYGFSRSSKFHQPSQLYPRSFVVVRIFKLSITLLTVVQSRFHILGIHATAHRLSLASILVPSLCFALSGFRIQVFSYHVADHLSWQATRKVVADVPAIGKHPSSCCPTDLITRRCPTVPLIPSSLPPGARLRRRYPRAPKAIHVGRVASVNNPRCRPHHLSLSSHPLTFSISSCRCLSSSSLLSSTSICCMHVTNYSIQALQELPLMEGILL
jgi:hypothetical protein